MEAADSADDIPSYSLIPYDTNRDVVLRHADTIVYRDPRTNQLVPFHRNQNTAVERRASNCPTCGRPFHQPPGSDTHDSGGSPMEDQPSFITHGYFDMLARSLPNSNDTSAPPSPRRRIIQPVRSRLRPSSSSATTTTTTTRSPPPDAEFVASTPAPPSQAHGISETAFSPHYFEKFFVEERELGRGGKGVVLLVKHVLDGVTLGHFACKRVPIGDDHAWLEKVLIEVQLLQGLSHQNLVSYRHVWLEDYQISTFGPSVPCAFILQQYCNGGDMHNYVLGAAQTTTTTQELKERIRRRSKGETEQLPGGRRGGPNEPKRLHFDEIYSFFRDITSGLRFLHHNNFIHRDLKPSNCLLDTSGGETRVLVSDFGEVQYEYATRKSTGATGTISYCAPEVLRRVAPDGPFQNFTSKSDIFSLGMILHFLCFATLPYRQANVLHEEREDIDQLRAEIMGWEGFDDQRKLRPELPAPLYTFLKRLLSLDPAERPSADDVLQVLTSGRLDDISTTGPRRRSSIDPEELTPGRRVQKLESPGPHPHPHKHRGSSSISVSPQRAAAAGPATNTRSRSRRLQQQQQQQNQQQKQQSSSSSALSRSRSRGGGDMKAGPGSGSGPVIQSDLDLDQSPSGYSSGGESSASLSRSRSRPHLHDMSTTANSRNMNGAMPVILRSKSKREHQDEKIPPPPLLLLEDNNINNNVIDNTHSPSSVQFRISSILNQRITSPSLKLLILALKLFSILQPCQSQFTDLSGGFNAAIVYPMIAVAVLEFSMRDLRVWKAALAMAVHVVVVVGAVKTGTLCRQPPARLAWDDGLG
ncbi:putative serine/threonine-protein kinase IKS1 [Exophiala dermatitidis]